jgi:hypothetical protein
VGLCSKPCTSSRARPFAVNSSLAKPRKSDERVTELFPRYWRRTFLAVLIVLSLGLLVGRDDLNSHHICQHPDGDLKLINPNSETELKRTSEALLPLLSSPASRMPGRDEHGHILTRTSVLDRLRATRGLD